MHHLDDIPDVAVAAASPDAAATRGVVATGAVRSLVRGLGRWVGRAAFVAAWALIAVMAAFTWVPHVTRFRTDVIIGQSMEPTIPLWSAIVVEPVEPASIHRGDVITFERPGDNRMKVTHRVTKVLHTKG